MMKITMKILKTILILTIIISNVFSVAAQELRSLDYNPSILKASEGSKTIKSRLKNADQVIPDSIEYFFEDFSDYNNSIYPSLTNWTDQSAYINSTYADSMISIGVATLDAYDKYGFPYENDFGPSMPSDTLTSISINLSGPISKSVFLSFFYEAGGKGDMPETDDSLLLDFYNAKNSVWYNRWGIPGGTQQHTFTQVILQVADSFFVNGFRFRFRNLSSIFSNVANKQSNADQWNLDYIQLKQADISDSMKNLNDVAISKLLLPYHTDYTTLPWRHYSLQRSKI
jgi:hypothetical protein